jgi:hypothetical protein
MKWLRFGDKGTDVERWQNFLCGYYRDARSRLVVDGDFGNLTLEYTKKFQAQHKIPVDGTVGNQTLGLAARFGFPLVISDDNQDGPNWPAVPNSLLIKPLSEYERELIFGKFSFVANPSQSNPEGIKITDGWGSKNIVSIKIPQLVNVSNSPRECIVKIHNKIANQFLGMWAAWEKEGLLHHVKTWNGSYVPRFIRGSRTRLSNHSWGTAFDINVQWNGLGVQPALKGTNGSVRELVPIALEYGFFWGGFFRNRPDGMHFEAHKVL